MPKKTLLRRGSAVIPHILPTNSAEDPFFSWDNEFPPHEYLGLLVHASEVPKLELHVSDLEGRTHLPIIDIKKAA